MKGGGHYYNRWGGNWGTFRSITEHRLVQRGDVVIVITEQLLIDWKNDCC